MPPYDDRLFAPPAPVLNAPGLRNKEIASRLHITEGTVKFHLHSIYEKLQIDGRYALMSYARDHGLA